MGSSRAWQEHGCYTLGASSYYNMPYDRALTGCDDEWNSLDHFDPTASLRLVLKRMNELRASYPSLQDGFSLYQRNNITHYIYLPGSNGTGTELGLWSVERGPSTYQINTQGSVFNNTDSVSVWLMYTNENATQEYQVDCTDTDNYLAAPYEAGTTVKNLFYPYDTAVLVNSSVSYYLNDLAPYRGCLANITMQPFEFKAYVPLSNWTAPIPVLTKFSPGHDYRLLSDGSNSFEIQFMYDQEMNCEDLTSAITITASTGGSTSTPTLGTASCATVSGQPRSEILAAPVSTWSYTATVSNAPDGIYQFHIASGVATQDATNATTVSLSKIIPDQVRCCAGFGMLIRRYLYLYPF